MTADRNSRRNKIEQHMMSLRKWGSENTEKYSALEAELEELQDPKASHPLTIPGELLAEACELGILRIGHQFKRDGRDIPRDGFFAHICYGVDEWKEGLGISPSEALSAAIAKAREYLGGVK